MKYLFIFLILLLAGGGLTSVAAAANYRGRWVEGTTGDTVALEAIDAAFESTQPSARMACTRPDPVPAGR